MRRLASWCAWYAFCALAGCAIAPVEQAPRVETVYVPIPQRVPCEPPPEPPYAVDALPIGAPIDDQTKALLADRSGRKGYIKELKEACR